MTQTEASYHRVPGEVPPPPSGCPVNGFTPFAPDYEANVALEVLTERVPSLRLVEPQSLERFANITFRGPRQLLVTWDT